MLEQGQCIYAYDNVTETIVAFQHTSNEYLHVQYVLLMT